MKTEGAGEALVTPRQPIQPSASERTADMSNDTRTNKRAQSCWYCGGLVPAGEGRLFFVQDDDEDEFGFQAGWLVEHLDGALCQAEIERAKREDAEAAARKAAEQQAREELRARNQAEYDAWKAENITGAGLVENNMYPWPADATAERDPEHTVYRSPELTGWMTTGDLYVAAEWHGERFLVNYYGNALVVYQSPAMREAWMRARWDEDRTSGWINRWDGRQTATPATVAADILGTLRQYGEWFPDGNFRVLGGDYYEWLRDNVPTAELVALAKQETHEIKVEITANKAKLEYLESLGVPVVAKEGF